MRYRLLLLLLPLLLGCTGPELSQEDPGNHAVGPVFLVHGAWPDNAYLWMDEMAEVLASRGIDAAPVPYFSLIGIGTEGPGERIAEFEQELRAHHAETECSAPLRFTGVGYSSGTEVLLEAALHGVRFERLYFAGSPLALWNTDLRQVLQSDHVERLVNYYSPMDLLMWITAGSGMFGYHGAGFAQDRVENRQHWWLHVTPLWNRTSRMHALADELAALDGPRHTCLQDPVYLTHYRAAKERLRSDW